MGEREIEERETERERECMRVYIRLTPVLYFIFYFHMQVWYAAHYAHKMGFAAHEMSEMDQQGKENLMRKLARYCSS